MQALQEADPAEVGTYRLLGRLGQGAMGVVYLGLSPGGGYVAVKLVRAELASDLDFRERFRREVEMARAVGGFWTAAVVDADPEADRPWLATEYVAGPSLQEAVETHGPLPEAAVRRLTVGLAEALTAIHSAGLVHRDLKPSNVLLGSTGPRVIDFGISHALERAKLTATGTVLGTPGFLSPEQISGGDVGPPADVFSLGAVLVYAATGRGPFGDGQQSALIYRAIHGQPDLSRVPAELRPVLGACLQRDPARRPTPLQLTKWVDTGQGAQLESTVWLPPPVQTMINRFSAELRGHELPTKPIARPASPAATLHYTVLAPDLSQPPSATAPPPSPPGGPTSPPMGRVEFATSWVTGLLWGSGSLVAALIAGQISAADSAGNLMRVIAFVFFFVFIVFAVRFLYATVRPRHALELGPHGLLVAKGRRRWQLPWRGIARLRIVEHRSKPWLAVWLADGWTPPNVLNSGSFGMSHGGIRIFPIGHERPRKRRDREVRELCAALAWHAPHLFDQNPGRS